MNDKLIINFVNDLRKEYLYYNDNDKKVINELALKIISSSVEERNYIIDFFLRELRTNYNNLEYLGLGVIEKMKITDVSKSIYNIYLDCYKEKKYEWRWHVIITLMKMEYKEPMDLYDNYVKEILNDDKWGRSFLLLVYYSFVNRNKSLSLLSDYYVKSFEIQDKQTAKFLENSVGMLISYFHHSKFEYVLNLLTVVNKKNEKAGKYLQSSIINFMKSKWIENGEFNKDLIKKQLALVQYGL